MSKAPLLPRRATPTTVRSFGVIAAASKSANARVDRRLTIEATIQL